MTALKTGREGDLGLVFRMRTWRGLRVQTTPRLWNMSGIEALMQRRFTKKTSFQHCGAVQSVDKVRYVCSHGKSRGRASFHGEAFGGSELGSTVGAHSLGSHESQLRKQKASIAKNKLQCRNN